MIIDSMCIEEMQIEAERDKKEVTHPAIVPYIKYQSYGTGVVYIRPIDGRILTIAYTPHFFSRYRERFLGDAGTHLTTDEVIHHMFVYGLTFFSWGFNI